MNNVSVNNTYTINGVSYSREELMGMCRSKLSYRGISEHERDLYEFICEWFNDKDYVSGHTSGTTGYPKEIMLYKDLMRESARRTISFFNLKKGENILLCLSVNYIAGKMMVVRALENNMNIVAVEPSVSALAEISEDIGFAAMVPYQVIRLLESAPEVFRRIKKIIIGGAKADNTLIDRLQYISSECFATYGMTESLSHIALMKLNKGKEDCYRCLSGIEIETDDRDCLVIKGVGDTVLITNDIVEIRDESSFVWLGRYDNAVNSGGVKIIPELIEERMQQVLTDRFVFSSLPDDYLGEKLILVIESIPYDESEMRILNEELLQRLSKYELPKEIVFVEKFKETSSGKIIRKDLLK